MVVFISLFVRFYMHSHVFFITYHLITECSLKDRKSSCNETFDNLTLIFFWTLYNSMCLYGPGYYGKLCEFTVSLVIYDSSLYFCLGIFILM